MLEWNILTFWVFHGNTCQFCSMIWKTGSIYVVRNFTKHFHGSLQGHPLLVDGEYYYMNILHTSKSTTVWLFRFPSPSLRIAPWWSEFSSIMLLSPFCNYPQSFSVPVSWYKPQSKGPHATAKISLKYKKFQTICFPLKVLPKIEPLCIQNTLHTQRSVNGEGSCDPSTSYTQPILRQLTKLWKFVKVWSVRNFAWDSTILHLSHL